MILHDNIKLLRLDNRDIHVLVNNTIIRINHHKQNHLVAFGKILSAGLLAKYYYPVTMTDISNFVKSIQFDDMSSYVRAITIKSNASITESDFLKYMDFDVNILDLKSLKEQLTKYNLDNPKKSSMVISEERKVQSQSEKMTAKLSVLKLQLRDVNRRIKTETKNLNKLKILSNDISTAMNYHIDIYNEHLHIMRCSAYNIHSIVHNRIS